MAATVSVRCVVLVRVACWRRTQSASSRSRTWRLFGSVSPSTESRSSASTCSFSGMPPTVGRPAPEQGRQAPRRPSGRVPAPSMAPATRPALVRETRTVGRSSGATNRTPQRQDCTANCTTTGRARRPAAGLRWPAGRSDETRPTRRLAPPRRPVRATAPPRDVAGVGRRKLRKTRRPPRDRGCESRSRLCGGWRLYGHVAMQWIRWLVLTGFADPRLEDRRGGLRIFAHDVGQFVFQRGAFLDCESRALRRVRVVVAAAAATTAG